MMKTNKLIARALILLGFGSVVGVSTGCGANRAQRSRQAQTSNPAPAADTTAIDFDTPVMALYGIPPSRFNPDGSVSGQRPVQPPRRQRPESPANSESSQPSESSEQSASPEQPAQPAQK